MLWDVGAMACTYTPEGHSSWVNDVVFSPQGDQLVSVSDTTIRLWSVTTGGCCLILAGHDDTVARVAYSHKGDLLASGGWDKTVRVWDVASGQCRAVVRNFQGAVFGVAWIPSPDTSFLFTGCQDGSVLKWQVIEEEEQCHVKLCWGAIKGSLTVTGASIQDVRGLTSLNKQLLKQRGAVGEPEDLFREASKKLITMSSVVSQMRQPSDRMVQGSPSVTKISEEQPQQQDKQQDGYQDEQQGEQQDEWQDEQQENSKRHRKRYRRIVRRVRR
jgi:WD40 repeat protein